MRQRQVSDRSYWHTNWRVWCNNLRERRCRLESARSTIAGRGRPIRWRKILLYSSRSVAADGNRFDAANLGVTIQRAPDYLKIEANNLAQELQTVIDGATWKEIRKRVYPK